MSYIYQLIKPAAKDHGVSFEIIQKDYALSFLLSAMAQTPGLGDKIALKGGTALKKLFYRDYRFSEDLDFSILEFGVLPNADELMQAAIQRMTALLENRGPFEVWVEPLVPSQPHPGQPMTYAVRVRFPDDRLAPCRLRVEISVDELVLLPVKSYSILHEYSEPYEGFMQGYALAEIAAEKLRALLQSQDQLASQGWGASRICQDYYDLWHILGQEKITGLPDLVARKCAARGITLPPSDEFVSPALLRTARREWNQQLRPFMAHLPLAERLLEEDRTMISTLFREG